MTISIRVTGLVCCAFVLFFSCAAAADPFTATALCTLAETCHKQGRYLEALSFYRDALQNSGPEGIPAGLYKNMGDIYADYLESYEQALACYRKQAELFPAHCSAPDAHLRIARTLYLQGLKEQARAHYRFIGKTFPDYAKKSSVAEELQRMEKKEQPAPLSALSTGQPLPGHIRVLLKNDADPAELSAPGGLNVYIDRQILFCAIPAGTRVSFRPDKDGIAIGSHGVVKTAVRIEAAAETGIEVDKTSYRGMLQIFLQDGKLMLVNHVPLEEYLYGVLAKEVPASWPAAALEAQAVAARTYALYNAVKNAPALFDLFSTTASQAYGGRDSEKSAARNAVDATRQRVLSYDGKLALTLYHANSGAMTEAPQDIWGWSSPYLQSRPDAFSRDMKNFTWNCSPAAEELAGRLQQAGFPQPALETITPLQRDSSGRITRIALQGGNRTAYLSGNSFRLLAGAGKIKSAQFSVERNKQSFIFNGSGYGHGVGMSQWGACSMARQGYRAEQILQWYYPGTAAVTVCYQNK